MDARDIDIQEGSIWEVKHQPSQVEPPDDKRPIIGDLYKYLGLVLYQGDIGFLFRVLDATEYEPNSEIIMSYVMCEKILVEAKHV